MRATNTDRAVKLQVLVTAVLLVLACAASLSA